MTKTKTYPEEVEEALAEMVETSQKLDLYDDQVQDDELDVVKLLEGSAKHFDLPEDLVERLVRHGIAAKTEDGLMRGFKWNTFVK